MTATFEFKLPEDKSDYEIYKQAPGMFSVIHEYRNQLRSWEKNNTVITLELVQKTFFGLLEQENITGI